MAPYILLASIVTMPAYALHFYHSSQEHLKVVHIPEIQLPSTPMACLSEDEQALQHVFYCPEVSTLVRKGTTWSAPGNWRSYQVSFMTQATRFLGAQWSGTNVGRVVCLYAGDNPNDFPIQLVFPALARTPSLPVWQLASDQSTANCLSNQSQVCDCPINMFETSASVDSARAAVIGIEGYSNLQPTTAAQAP